MIEIPLKNQRPLGGFLEKTYQTVWKGQAVFSILYL